MMFRATSPPDERAMAIKYRSTTFAFYATIAALFVDAIARSAKSSGFVPAQDLFLIISFGCAIAGLMEWWLRADEPPSVAQRRRTVAWLGAGVVVALMILLLFSGATGLLAVGVVGGILVVYLLAWFVMGRRRLPEE